MVGVAQLVRASGCGPEGRGFESHHSPHKEIAEPQAVPLFLYGVNESFHDSNPLQVACNLFSVRGVRISSFAGIYAHAWVQNPIKDARFARVIFALCASDIASQ